MISIKQFAQDFNIELAHLFVEEEILVDAKVEEIALQHFIDSGFSGIYGENRFPLTVLNLIFWQEIFCDIPETVAPAFREDIVPGREKVRVPFRTIRNGVDFGNGIPIWEVPRDLSNNFWSPREKIIAKKISLIKEVGMKKVVELNIKYWENSPYPHSHWLSFSEYSKVLEAVEIIGLDGILKMFSYIYKDDVYYERRNGWPDLFIWDKTSSFFCEVKGPGDALHKSQRRWFEDNYKKLGFEAKILSVEVKK